jgi:hypothetical protein
MDFCKKVEKITLFSSGWRDSGKKPAGCGGALLAGRGVGQLLPGRLGIAAPGRLFAIGLRLLA